MMNDVQISASADGSNYNIEISSDRRADIESKQGHVAALLRETGRDGLLLMDPANVAWITSGATARGNIDPRSFPVVYCTADARWLIISNADSQRFFDEELDGMGFQVKEWPWYWGREQLLSDLCANRKVACDQHPGPPAEADFLLVRDRLYAKRSVLSPYEQACLLALGQHVAHALEAACRTLQRKDSEREVAGQIAHRLIHRGVHPVHVGVAADGRNKSYRRVGYTATEIGQYAVVSTVARKYGLHVSASRMVCFGEPPEQFKNECSAVVRVSAGYLASTWPDAVPREILLAGQRIYSLSGFEHEWLLAPQGYLIGRQPVESIFTNQASMLLQPGHAISWSASAGGAVSCDTYLVTESGPRPVTPPEIWPMKRIRIQGAECIRPDILIR